MTECTAGRLWGREGAAGEREFVAVQAVLGERHNREVEGESGWRCWVIVLVERGGGCGERGNAGGFLGQRRGGVMTEACHL